MVTNALVSGYYQLPVPVAVSRDVLGSVSKTTINDIPVLVYAPLAMESDYPALPPRLPHIPTDELGDYGNPFKWAITFAGDYTEDGATCLLRLGMALQKPTNDLPAHPRDSGLMEDRVTYAMLEGLDAWLERFRSWIEVLTLQDLDHHQPRYDVRFLGDGFFRWGGSNWLTKELSESSTRQITPVSVQDWNVLLRRSGNGEEPPLEHLLARDARASFARSDLRRSAIDAGTAVEVVMSMLYRENVSFIPESDRLQLDQRNLNSLAQVFRNCDISYGVTDTALSSLILARNKAAHEAYETPRSEMDDVMKTMHKIVAEHGNDLAGRP